MAFNETELLKVLSGADLREEVKNNLVSLRWAHVTSLDPLEVRREGEFSDIAITGSTIPVEALRIGDRVRISSHGSKAFIESSWDVSSRTDETIHTGPNANDKIRDDLVEQGDVLDGVQVDLDEAYDRATQATIDAEEAHGLATQASIDAADAHNIAVQAEEAVRKSAAIVRIDSSNGVLFKQNTVSTVLTVTIFRGDKVVTNAVDMWEVFGVTAYLEWQWKRMGDTDFSTISSADPRVGAGGFTLTLTPDDVDTKVVFRCILNGE